jgi:hypothetical protein
LDLRQLDGQDIEAGLNFTPVRPHGSIQPHAPLLSAADQRVRFITEDIYTTLEAMGGNLFAYCTGGHIMRYQKRQPGGMFMVGADHLVHSLARGFLHIVAIDVGPEDGARMVLEYIPLSIAGENPLAETKGVNLFFAPAPAYMSQFFMGGATLNDIALLGLVRFRLLPGIVFRAMRSDGGVFYRAGASVISHAEPLMEFHFLNAAIATDISGITGNFRGYLQRGTTLADGRIHPAAASHIRFQASEGIWTLVKAGVEDIGDTVAILQVRPTGSISYALNVPLGG